MRTLMTICLVLALCLSAACRDDRTGPRDTSQDTEPVRAKTLAQTAFEKACDAEANHPDDPLLLEKMFLDVETCYPDSEWAPRAHAKAGAWHAVSGEHAVRELLKVEISLLNAGGDINELIDRYLQVIDAYAATPAEAAARANLQRLLNEQITVSLSSRIRGDGLGVVINASIDTAIVPEYLICRWETEGMVYGGEYFLEHAFAGPGLHRVRATILALGIPAGTAETTLDLRPSSFRAWRAWVLDTLTENAPSGLALFTVTLQDGRKFEARRTAGGYQADLEFGSMAINDAEVVSAVPTASLVARFKEALAGVSDLSDSSVFIRIRREFGDDIRIAAMLDWWLVYLNPGDMQYQLRVGAASACSACGGKGLVPFGARTKCPSCLGLGTKPCEECANFGWIACPYCRGKSQTGVQTTTGGSGTIRTVVAKQCPACRNNRRITCSRCVGTRSLECSACRGQGWTVLQAACSVCKGNENKLAVLKGGDFPFLKARYRESQD